MLNANKVYNRTGQWTSDEFRFSTCTSLEMEKNWPEGTPHCKLIALYKR